MENEILHKEIDLIQGVINRMANNSFLLKGWLISLIAVILALSKDSILTADIRYISTILILPVIVFWYLDAFFLHKEKCYRKLYEWVIQNRSKTDDFLYSLDYSRFKIEVNRTRVIMFSKTLLPFYGITLCILIGISVYNNFM
ncbi:MAG: hypothetical protein DRJ10_02445 [Bacteroidetes bacterium]|nr:MAG: hypothetical protein DRJ10_02445 [Bacteroidota bacterium]